MYKRVLDPLDTLAFVAGVTETIQLGALRKAWHDAKRTPANPEVIVRVNHGYIAERPLGADRQFLTGSVEQIHADLGQLAAWGATKVFFDLSDRYALLPDGYQQMLEQLARLWEIVAPVQRM